MLPTQEEKMHTDYLTERMRIAYNRKSLRELAVICDVSHEQIRKVLKAKSKLNLTFFIYDKIDRGLLKNGF
jgi:hypothetical protein